MNSSKRVRTLRQKLSIILTISLAAMIWGPARLRAQTAPTTGYGQFMYAASFFEPDSSPFDGIDVGARSKPALVDIDADGDLDLFIGEADGLINFFENTGDPAAAEFTQQTGGLNPFSGEDVGSDSAPAFGDLDGDGDMDAVVGAADYRLFYYKNIGTTSEAVFELQSGAADPFSAVAGSATYFHSPTTPTLADLNGDGRIDVVVGQGVGGMSFFHNSGTPTNPVFTGKLDGENPFDGYEIGTDSVPFAVDRNGNGRPEGFLVGRRNGDLRVAVRNGSGQFIDPGTRNRPFTQSRLQGGRSAPAMADLDHDGLFEMVVGGDDGKLRYYKPAGVTYLDWQNENFNLPSESDQAAPGIDFDGDRIVNLLEYAMGLLPKTAETNVFAPPTLTLAGHLTTTLQIRDDVSLTIAAEFSDSLDFSLVSEAAPVVSDPDPDDSARTLTFTDPLKGSSKRFVRLKLSPGP